MTGLLLLDVDGPLNPYAAKPTVRPAGYQTFRYTASGGWYRGRDARRHKGLRVWLNPEHGPQLLDLAADTGLTLVWATTWMHEANTLIGPAIGLPPLPVIEFPADDLAGGAWRSGGGWKWHTVAQYAAGMPMAWLDDEHSHYLHLDSRAAFDRTRADVPTLLHHVDPRHGLRDDDLESVRQWARHHQLRRA